MYAPLLYYINYEGNSYLIAKKEIREDVFFYNLFYFLCGGSGGRENSRTTECLPCNKYIQDGSCSSSRLCGLEKSCFLGTDCVYFPIALLFLITCSMSACSDVSSLMSYLARIFMMGRIFSHHCVLGMRCLQPREEGQLLRELKLNHFGAR